MYMAWRTLARYVESLEDSGELIRVSDPVNVELEAGCFADRLVKRGVALFYSNNHVFRMARLVICH